MTPSAHDVAAVLRQRLPGLAAKKLHMLLYYCQGHHLAAFGRPLFNESIRAWDRGPVVGSLWYAEKHGRDGPVRRQLDEAALNTVGYVLSRYGALTGQDLENLTHSEEPWRLADSGRRPGDSVPIELRWMEHYFATGGRPDRGEPALDSAEVTRWLQDAEQRRADDLRIDSAEELRS